MPPHGGGKSPALPSFARILLATDFSAHSDAAVSFARLLADYYDSKIFVAHVLPTEAPDSEPALPDEDAQAQMQNFLSENLLRRAPAAVILQRGAVSEVLAHIIEERKIDLAVLGTHGRTGVGKLMLGSVAQRIFGAASCPVLTVGRRARSSGKLSTILFPTNFSKESLQALPYALSLAKVAKAELLLLHAVQPGTAGPHPPADMRGYHEHLSALIPAKAKSWCHFDTLAIAGEPAEVLLTSAAERNADLIVMSARRIEGPLYTLQVPLSTAYQVVARAVCPVLRVRT